MTVLFVGVFEWNLRRLPFVGQVFNLERVLHTGFDYEHVDLFLCHIFTQSPMNDQKIEQSNERRFGLQQVLAKSIEKLYLMRADPKFTKHQNLFDSQTKSVSQEYYYVL